MKVSYLIRGEFYLLRDELTLEESKLIQLSDLRCLHIANLDLFSQCVEEWLPPPPGGGNPTWPQWATATDAQKQIMKTHMLLHNIPIKEPK